VQLSADEKKIAKEYYLADPKSRSLDNIGSSAFVAHGKALKAVIETLSADEKK
jgi:hypothetical protein